MCMVSPFDEVYGFVVRCNMCSIMCEAWASTFVPCLDTLELQKSLIYWGMYWCIMKQVCWISSTKLFFHISHPTGTQNFAFMGLLDRFACFPCNSRKSMWRTFFNLKHVCNNPFYGHDLNGKWSRLKEEKGVGHFWTFSNAFHVDLGMLPPHTSTP